MKFFETKLNGVYVIELDRKNDERGFFARAYCKNEFEKLGLDANILQINNSFSKYKGTLRGIHYQLQPKAETKIVRCIKGAMWDLVLDLRSESDTFGQWYGTKLTAENRKMMYAPKDFGHAFITLEDNTEILYLITEFYEPEYERIIRWNDPNFGIKWPIKPNIISDKDNNALLFDQNYHLKIQE